MRPAEYARAAVDLLPLIAWHGLSRQDRIQALTSVNGLAGDAAGCAIAAGRLDAALRLLEHARGVLFAQATQARAHLADLDALAPDLAPRMREVRRRLDAPDLVADPASPAPGIEDHSVRRRSLAAEWERLVAQARTRTGLEGFPRPPEIPTPDVVAAGGPVVIVVMSRYRCDALLLTGDGFRVVPLPALDRRAALERVETLFGALGSDAALTNHPLDEVLAWLWDVVVAPVVAALQIDSGATAPPRIWWCPTGELSFLPLHAAGRQAAHGRGESLLDLAASSYTPTLHALVAARQATAQAPPSGRVLAVGLARTPVLPPLRKVEDELRVLAERGECTVLRDEEATKQRVLAELPAAGWFHFAGPGSEDLRALAAGALYCHDHLSAGPIGIDDVMRLDTRGARLAFLSACETAQGAWRLPDEAAHIAGALQIAGFTHVLATAWRVGDRIAAAAARRFYSLLPELLDAGTAAVALNATARYLRDERGLPAVCWAPYLHFGP